MTWPSRVLSCNYGIPSRFPLLVILQIRSINKFIAGFEENDLVIQVDPFLEAFVDDDESRCLCPLLQYFKFNNINSFECLARNSAKFYSSKKYESRSKQTGRCFYYRRV